MEQSRYLTDRQQPYCLYNHQSSVNSTQTNTVLIERTQQCTVLIVNTILSFHCINYLHRIYQLINLTSNENSALSHGLCHTEAISILTLIPAVVARTIYRGEKTL